MHSGYCSGACHRGFGFRRAGCAPRGPQIRSVAARGVAWGSDQCSESQVVDLLSGILPPFLSGDASQATVEMATFGGGFMAVTFTVFAIYGLFAEALPVRLL